MLHTYTVPAIASQSNKHLYLFIIYVLSFSLLLWGIGLNENIVEAAQYYFALKVYSALLACSVIFMILDLIWSTDSLNMSEKALAFRLAVYLAGLTAGCFLMGYLLYSNTPENFEYSIQSNQVQTSELDTTYNQYRTTTQNGVVVYTPEKYEYGQNIKYIKGISTFRITKDIQTQYTSIPKGLM